jgi:hypothetical protein
MSCKRSGQYLVNEKNIFKFRYKNKIIHLCYANLESVLCITTMQKGILHICINSNIPLKKKSEILHHVLKGKRNITRIKTFYDRSIFVKEY